MGALDEDAGSTGAGSPIPWHGWILLAFVALVALWPGQTTIPVMDRDEARYAQASRQMLESGDFVDIRFQETARLVKPAGIYWLQAGGAALAGGADAAIWAYRLPSLMGAVVAVLVTAWLGARMGGASVGMTAGLLLAVSLVVSVEARTAKTDAVLLAVVTLAQAALFVIVQRGADQASRFFGAPLVFWAASGMGLMIKGPIGALVSATTILALVVWRRQVRWLRHLRIGPGLLLLLAIAAPWIVAITLRTDGGFLQESVGHSLLGKVARSDDAHGAPPGYHTVLFFITFWPGALFAGLAGVYAWIRRRETAVRFLIAWTVPTWIVFEAVVTKLPHYTLPVYPAIAILAAMAIREAPVVLQRTFARRLHWVAIVLFVAVGSLLALVPAVATQVLDQRVSVVSLLAAVFGGLAVAAGVYVARAPQTRSLAPLIACVAVFYAITFYAAIPAVHALWPSSRIGAIVRELDGCDDIVVATAGYREPSNVFVLGTHAVLGSGEMAADLLIEQPACAVVAVDVSEREPFEKRMEQAGAAWRTLARVEGINYSKGDPLTLDLMVSASSRLHLAPRGEAQTALTSVLDARP